MDLANLVMGALLLFGAGCAPAPAPRGDLGGALGPPRPGRYSARIEQSSGSCCSQSCGAHSTVASITLDIEEGGRAEASWTREGCTVLVTGDGPLEMPYDPGPPEAVCRQITGPGERREVNALDGAARLRGAWTRDGTLLRVDLRSDASPSTSWAFRCARVLIRSQGARVFGPLLACRFVDDLPWDQSIGFAVDGVIYLDDRPGLLVRSGQRGPWNRDEVALERR